MLPIVSRVLSRILATRSRVWAEEMNPLDENQAGFKKDRSTADATQSFIRIQEDSMILQNALDEQSQPRDNSEQPKHIY